MKDLFTYFAQRIQLDEATSCWNWLGTLTKTGYAHGYRKVFGCTQMYRGAYIYFRGAIPPTLECHHKCRNRKCVNPWHLELVTHAENCRLDFWTTHCKNGHEYVEGSYYQRTDKNGRIQRHCKICTKAKAAAWYEANKEKANRRNMAYYALHRKERKAMMRLYHKRTSAK